MTLGTVLPLPTHEPPHNLELEMVLLGAIMVRENAMDTAAEVLRPFHFFAPAHAAIFRAAFDMHQSGAAVTVAALRTYLDRDPEVRTLGGARYLAECMAATLDPHSVADYANSIRELWMRRQAIEALRDGLNRAADPSMDDPIARIIEDTETRLYALAETGRDSGPRSMADILPNVLKRIEAAQNSRGVIGVSTGLASVDRLTGGLQATDLVILAGRPGMGKTELAFRIAFNAAQTGRRVFGASLEMSAEQIVNREFAAETGLDSDRLRRGEFARAEWPRLNDTSATMLRLPIEIDDTPGLTVAQIRSRARRFKRRGGLDLLVIDYLQLIRGRGENRNAEIGGISRALKGLAKELDCCVLCLSQLSRAVESREDKRPMLADLRDSGSIEQDADAVWFLYRHAYYLREPEKRENESDQKFSERMLAYRVERDRCQNLADLIVAKQRSGPLGTVHLFCDVTTCRFGDLNNRPSMELA